MTKARMEQFRELLLDYYLECCRREGRHIGQNEYAANYLHVSPTSYSEWRTDDRRYPGIENLLILSKTLGPRVFEIFDREPVVSLPKDPLTRWLINEMASGEISREDLEAIKERVQRRRLAEANS